MRVLVTGIEGFVGSHLAEHLLTIPGVEVHGTILNPALNANIAHLQNSLSLHPVDLLDRQRLDKVISDIRPERIFHLAGQAFLPAAFRDPVATFQANIIGGVNLLDALRQHSMMQSEHCRVLVVSTGEVYGRPEGLPVTEEFPLAPNNPYAVSKASIDMIARQYRTSYGVPVVVARPFNHVGPRQSPAFVCADFAQQFAEISLGKRPPKLHVGNISVRRDFTDVRDVVKAYWLLLEKDHLDSVFNICTGTSLSIDSILSMLEDLVGVKVSFVQEAERLRTYDIPEVRGSYERLHRATGWEPTIPIATTLRDVLTYWKQQVA
jgi:GDP-4-dehydro-6-deoxy-D-mannose reductase